MRRKFNLKVSDDNKFLALALLTGVLSAIAAYLLHESVTLLVNLLGTHQAFTLKSFIGGGICVLISGWISTKMLPSTSGSGIPHIRIAITVFKGKLTKFQTFFKAIASILSLGSGLSLGREGPTVMVTSGIGSYLAQLFKLNKSLSRNLMAIGCSGGLAAAFNTPIAAVLFTLEEIVGDMDTKNLGPIIVSAVVASVVTSYIHGNHPVFSILSYELKDERELFYYLILGLLASGIGNLWVQSIVYMRGWGMKVFKSHKLTFIFLTFLVMGGVSFINPMVLGDGKNVINTILQSELKSPLILLGLFVLKFLCTTLCYSSGVSGGIFFPTLFMGATLGAIVGSFAHYFTPDMVANVGAYAIVGMGAFFVAVVRAPFTSIIMIFEMTHDYKIILPLMTANIVSYFFAEKIKKGSLYEHISEQEGVHLPNKDDNEVLNSMIIEEAMTERVSYLRHNDSIDWAQKAMGQFHHNVLPVVKYGKLLGIISRKNILDALENGRDPSEAIVDLCRTDVVHVYPDQSLMVALEKLKRYEVSRLIVVHRMDDKRIVGIITAEDIVNHFGFHIHHN